MRLGKGLKKNSDLSLWSRTLLILISGLVSLPIQVHADPNVGDIPLPPVSFTRVTDTDTLIKIGLDGFGAAWCYDDEANAILITAPAREQAKCELKLMYDLEKQKVKYEFELEKLNLRVDTLKKQHAAILAIKDREIDRLTSAALKRPNDYVVWWAAGSFATGVALTALLFVNFGH